MTSTQNSSMKGSAVRGGLVTAASQIVKMIIQLASVVVLARLLMPEDFGLIAAVGPIAAFIGLFQDFGLQQAVIQRKQISSEQLNQIFWLSTLVGICCTVLLIALAPAVASFYDDPRMTAITVVISLPILLSSFAALPLALMNRHLKFGQLAWTDIIAAISGFIATILAAYNGFGYWSLCIGPAVSATMSLFAAWWFTGWLPNKPTIRVDKDIFSFGANLTGFNIVNFFSRNLDNILIGKFAGSIELGYYDRAYKLLMFPLQNITQPLTRVMVPLLSRIQDDKPRFRAVYIKTNWLLAVVTMPGIAALTLAAQPVVDLLFGERWSPIAPIFAWLGVASLLQPVSSTTGWVFICQGKTKTMFRWGIYSSLTAVLSFIIGLNWGATGVAAAYAISGYLLRVPVLAVVLQRVGPISAKDFLSIQGLFLISALMSWGVYYMLTAQIVSMSNLSAIAISVVTNYSIAVLLTLLIPSSRNIVVGTLKQIVGRSG